MRKSIWRLIVGVILLAGVANSLQKLPNIDPPVRVWYLIFNLLFAAIGVWLAVSYFRRSN
jgi:hypothetical protein